MTVTFAGRQYHSLMRLKEPVFSAMDRLEAGTIVAPEVVHHYADGRTSFTIRTERNIVIREVDEHKLEKVQS